MADNSMRIRRLNNDGTIETIAGGGQPPDGIGDGLPATEASMQTGGFGFDRAGNMYVDDLTAQEVRRVDATTGVISAVPQAASLGAPYRLAVAYRPPHECNSSGSSVSVSIVAFGTATPVGNP